MPTRLLAAALIALLTLAACGGAADSGDPVAAGQGLFVRQCAGCHAVAADGPEALGPNLAGVAGRAAANPDGLSAEDWLRRAIVNPNAEIAPGYQAGLMPASYGQSLSPAELDALVAYMLSLE